MTEDHASPGMQASCNVAVTQLVRRSEPEKNPTAALLLLAQAQAAHPDDLPFPWTAMNVLAALFGQQLPGTAQSRG